MRNWRILTIGLSAALFILLVIAFAPMVKVSYLTDETYQTTETYFVKEPYTVIEEYTVMEPYTEIEVYCGVEPCEKYIEVDYSVLSVKGYNFQGGWECAVELYIRNNDMVGGVFTVECQMLLMGDITRMLSESKYILPGRTERFLFVYTGGTLWNLHSFAYSVSPPTKLNPAHTEVEVVKYREVTRYGEVTKYRFIPQEETVLKTRTVTGSKWVSVLRYLMMEKTP